MAVKIIGDGNVMFIGKDKDIGLYFVEYQRLIIEVYI